MNTFSIKRALPDNRLWPVDVAIRNSLVPPEWSAEEIEPRAGAFYIEDDADFIDEYISPRLRLMERS